MQNANIEKFYEVATTDAGIAKALLAGATSPADVIQRAVDKAGEQGLTFTFAEAESWIDAQRAAKANGELTDFQLEQVAGGKGGATEAFYSAADDVATTAEKVVEKTVNTFEPLVESVAEDAESAANDVADWVKSW